MSTDPKSPPTSSPADPTPEDDNTGFGAFGGSEGTGFDYAAFEENLNAEQEEAEDEQFTDPGMVDEQVESRPTIDLRRVPQDDATYDTRELGKYTVVTIRGRVNESFPGEAIGEKLRGSVVFDLTEVDRITSFGVRAWLQMLDLAKMKEAVFVRASPAVVNQVTMMRNFCGPARIHSLVAPYSCENCGNEFGVTYEAIGDRTALRARNPLIIECPQCRNGAELDEDPWVFFGIDDQLIDEVNEELAKVLENLGERPNHAPIEKSIIEDTTRVRFNGAVDKTTRFPRAFSGLEGKIVVDLRTATSVDSDGIDGLFDNLTRLDDAISGVQLEGCPIQLLERLLEKDLPKIDIRSVTTEVRSIQRDMTRPVLVDLRRHRAPLQQGRIPDLDIPWRDEPISLEGLEILTAAAKKIGEEAPATKSPPLSAPSSTAVVATPAPMVLPIAAALGALGVLLLILALGMMVFMGSGETNEDPTPPETIAPARVDGTWSSGGLLPPDWSERGITTESDAYLVAGIGSGPSVSEALDNARAAALGKLITQVGPSLTTTFAGDALPTTGPENEAALKRFVTPASALPLERTQEASRRTSDGRHEVAVQYKLAKPDVESWVAEFRKTGDFRGLTFTPRPPWTQPGLRLTERASYLRSGEPGDLLLTIGGKPISTLEQLASDGAAAFTALRPGEALKLQLDRDGEPVVIEFSKPRPAPPVAPPAPEPPTRTVLPARPVPATP